MSQYRTRTSDDESLSVSALFRLLADSRRRAVIGLLLDHDRTLTTNDLTKRIAAREHDAPVTDVPAEAVTRIHTSLAHSHLPKLADTPLVRYDPERDRVEPTEHLADLESFLGDVCETESVSGLREG